MKLFLICGYCPLPWWKRRSWSAKTKSKKSPAGFKQSLKWLEKY